MKNYINKRTNERTKERKKERMNERNNTSSKDVTELEYNKSKEKETKVRMK